jgi:hypothetical protein
MQWVTPIFSSNEEGNKLGVGKLSKSNIKTKIQPRH